MTESRTKTSINAKQKMYCESVLAYCAQKIRASWWSYVAKFECNGKVFTAKTVTGIDRIEDFANDFTSNIILKVKIKVADYREILFPNRNDFKVNLIQEEMHESKEFDLSSPRRLSRRYRGKFIRTNDSGMSSRDSRTPQNTEVAYSEMDVMDFEVQLIELAAEWISKTTFGGIVGQCTAGDAVKYFIGEQARLTEVDTSLKLDGVHMIDPDVTEKKTQIVVPHGTNTLLIPDYVQKEWGGIYNHGIGCYVYQKHVFVYPIYNMTRFKKEKLKLTVVIVPRGMMGENKRSFVTNNGELTIVVSGEVNQHDIAENQQANEGNGKVVFDPQKMMDEGVRVEENKLFIDSSKYTSQFLANKRADKMDFTTFAERDMSKNIAQAASEVTSIQGRYFTGLWEFSKPDLIIPMMPCRIVYFKRDVKHEVFGVVHKVQSVTKLQFGEKEKRYITNTGIVMYVNKENQER